MLQSFTFDDGSIDFDSFEIVTHAGEAQRISKRESQLRGFDFQAGQVVSREEILEVVCGYHAFPNTRTIDNHIVTFRKYFEKDPKIRSTSPLSGVLLQIY